MRFSHFTAALAALSSAAVQAASTFSPARPPALPLAVGSPYLNIWLHGEAGGNLPGSWPTFWTGRITGWQGFVRVDGSTYNWMGQAPGPSTVTQVSYEYTSTKSIFTFDVAGKVTMTVTFLTPVYPDDLVKQSLQFSYVNVKVASSDGGSHSVQVYTDVSGEWASADVSKKITWDYQTSGNVGFHQFQLDQQQIFKESSDQANWGTWFLATSTADGLTFKSGSDTSVRDQFTSNGKLDNTKDTNFRAVSDDWPVFGLAQDLGSVSSDSKEVLFTIGVSQDQVVNFQGATPEPVGLGAVWKSKYPTAVSSLEAFHGDWTAALSYATILDSKIKEDSVAAANDDYATITTLTVRQVFGALQPAQGSTQSYIFLKEISSNGDSQTVDVIFPTHPILLYLNATMVKLLLDPLYENQETGHYPKTSAIHDLGIFPNSLGYPEGNDEPMPLEECGNMVIMTLAYAQRTGDNAYLTQHWPRLDQWAQYLVNDSLIPADQLSTDDFAGTLANQTNLALKGIIGLKAMSEIAKRTNNEDKYGSIADDYLSKWKGFGINSAANPPHTILAYNKPDTHGLLYNLYADKLLGLDFVDQSVYDMQSNFYPTVALKYGVALDTRHNWTKSDWEIWCAAIASTETRDMILQLLVRWINETPTTHPLADIFDAATGDFGDAPGFAARPVVGGSFALLALRQ